MVFKGAFDKHELLMIAKCRPSFFVKAIPVEILMYIITPTRNSTTLSFRRYKQSPDLRVINYVMALLMLTVRNSQCLSTRFFQNALQTLNTLFSLLIFNSVEKKIVIGPS